MSDHRTLLIAGDIHGNPYHVTYLFQEALNAGVNGILQVGDMGCWEHYDMGSYFALCSDLAVQNNLPLYWIDGNHENFDLLFRKYGPGGPCHEMTEEGFWRIRDGVYYIPRGTRWNWSGVELMGLGGAYSIDGHPRRLEEEEILQAYERGQRTGKIGRLGAMLANGDHVSWWPQEEITDADVDRALSSLEPVDVLFTHDKPRNADPGWKRSILRPALANQDKIQRVVDTLKPRILMHGHLHHPYEQTITGYDYATRVVSLNCDLPKKFYDEDEPESFHNNPAVQDRLQESWVILDLDKVKDYHP